MDAVLSRDDIMRNRSSDIVPFNGCKIADSKHKITCRCSLCMHQLTFCTSITWTQPGRAWQPCATAASVRHKVQWCENHPMHFLLSRDKMETNDRGDK